MKVLLLVGSPRGANSTSESLGTYLLERLAEKGLQTEKVRIYPALKTDDGIAGLLSATDHADIIVLAFPVYVDSLPAPVIKTLEFVAKHRKANPPPARQLFLAITNCGFPETSHCETAVAICRRFAREAEFDWAGGLALGGGGALNGQALKQAGGMARNVIKSLDLAAGEIAQGGPVSQQALDLMARPVIPAWLYRFFGNWGWKEQAKKLNTQNRLKEQPYK